MCAGITLFVLSNNVDHYLGDTPEESDSIFVCRKMDFLRLLWTLLTVFYVFVPT
jgi:hypothetical protein